jgi:23S rRNA pseudouridine1911/1915/1917 synthase
VSEKSVRRRVERPGRLARLVHELDPGSSFSRAKRAVLDGQVEVDGEAVRDPGAIVAAGAELDWDPARPISRATGVPRIALLHADDDVVVALKPAGLLSMPTPNREKDTLVSRVALAVTRRRGERPYLAVAHRLDRDTSGLIAVAASRRGLEALQSQLRDRSMTRRYSAVIEGDLGAEAGTFDRALIGDGVRRRRWVTRLGERGKPAVTHWRVLRRFGAATLVEVALETGRTHQIRIHFAAAGHPVVGDPVYRAGGGAPMTIDFPRQALHAGELAFLHPADRRPMRFTAPPPDDFERLLERLAAVKIRPSR